MDAELARLVAAGAHDAAGLRIAADDDRLVAEFRAVALFDGREERIEVDVDDGQAAGGHGPNDGAARNTWRGAVAGRGQATAVGRPT